MLGSEASYVQAVLKQEFDIATLTANFQPISAAGFSDTVKILKIFNPSLAVSMDVSFDGVTAQDFIPPLSTLIVDFQSNHADGPTYTNGTLNLYRGQKLWVRTASNPSFLQVIGYR